MNSAFESFFSKIHAHRWKSLRESLLQRECQVARRNYFCHEEVVAPANSQEVLPSCFVKSWTEKKSLDLHPQRTTSQLLDFYIMDPASVIVARSLGVQSGDRVLDMCAAPGGKTLILAEALHEAGELIANELSESRRERLKKVIQNYVPMSVRSRVWVKGQDAIKFGLKEPDSFDRILLDAPCSGERHLLENEKEYLQWSESRTKSMGQRQYGLICSALLSLKAGGRLIYSTCSISPYENDEVVRKFLKKKGDQIQSLSAKECIEEHTPHSSFLQFEETEFGVSFLPDRCGYGPMYFAAFTKI